MFFTVSRSLVFTALVLRPPHPRRGAGHQAPRCRGCRRGADAPRDRPGLMSGRIADIAVHPTRPQHVVRRGRLGRRLEDDQRRHHFDARVRRPAVVLDRRDHDRPDATPRSSGSAPARTSAAAMSAGATASTAAATAAARWQRMGLPNSEHIGRILVDPRDGDVVLVAAEGPLWSAGGERGVYRSTDGGTTWTPVLPDRREHRRHRPRVRSRRIPTWSTPRRTSAGATSGASSAAGRGRASTSPPTTARPGARSTTGLPKGDMGKIGLAVTPADPVDSSTRRSKPDGEERGFYRSRDRGESWEKRNGYISGGTGPHYYQEIEASPTRRRRRLPDGRLPPGDARRRHDVRRSSRPGTTSTATTTRCGSIPANGEHLLVGTDAGLYESFDEGHDVRATSRTCRSRSSTRWRSTTASRSTTSSAARRTSARCTARRARSTATASATRTGTCRWAPTATASPSIRATPTSST